MAVVGKQEQAMKPVDCTPSRTWTAISLRRENRHDNQGTVGPDVIRGNRGIQ